MIDLAGKLDFGEVYPPGNQDRFKKLLLDYRINQLKPNQSRRFGCQFTLARDCKSWLEVAQRKWQKHVSVYCR